LAGCSIPLPARIVAVCDAFDAMTTARPHSSSLPLDTALEQLRAHAGMQFDPGAVEAFRALLGRPPRPAISIAKPGR
jgi:HD-GYP domain-containing protein (c-di-GMP phosphodiesterase class II)